MVFVLAMTVYPTGLEYGSENASVSPFCPPVTNNTLALDTGGKPETTMLGFVQLYLLIQ